MPVIEKMPGASFEIWHDGVLIAVVYDDKILANATENVDIIFGEMDGDKTWMN